MRTRTLARSGRDLAAARLLTFSAYGSIVLPEDITGATDVVLSATVGQATDALRTLAALESPSDDDVAEGKRLVDLIKKGQGELNARGAQAGQRKDTLGGLLSELDTPQVDDAGEAPAEPNVAVEEPVEVAAAADAVVAGAGTPAPKASDVKAAGGGSTPAARRARRSPMALVASADALEVATGHVYGDFMYAAQGILARTSGYPTGGNGGSRSRLQHGALRLRREFDAGLIASAVDGGAEAVEYATSLARVGGADALLASATVPAEGMTAGGGWGSPSEQLYDMVELEATDGMFDVPEVQIVRGGVKFTRGPEFSTFRGKGFKQTEAQAIAGTLKTFYRIPDGPDFVEDRAGVTGLGVTVGILQNKAYPEYVARVLRGLLVAHAHEVNADTLAAIDTGSTAVTIPATAGAFAPLLAAIELQATDLRTKHGMDDNTVLECALPTWIIPVIRQDLAAQNGWNARRIPDSEIIAHFAERRVRPQFVKDWQDTAIGQAAAATAWPATVKFLLYPAGTWVRGLGDVLSVDSIYDSAGLADNEYTGLFTEESFLVSRKGHESRKVTVTITPDGSTPAKFLVDNIETANV